MKQSWTGLGERERGEREREGGREREREIRGGREKEDETTARRRRERWTQMDKARVEEVGGGRRDEG